MTAPNQDRRVPDAVFLITDPWKPPPQIPFSPRMYKKPAERMNMHESAPIQPQPDRISLPQVGAATTPPLPGAPETPAHGAGYRTDQDRATSVAIRAWARSQGIDVASTGRLLAWVRQAWQAAGCPIIADARCAQPGCDRVANHSADPPRCARCYRFHIYAAARDRYPGTFGAPSLYVCDECPAQAAHWVLLPDAAPEAGADDYRPLCRPCHARERDQAAGSRELPGQGVLDRMPANTRPIRRPLRHYRGVGR